jgi:tripartite-type tricarboxylate transporter receptor subunit TctC
VFAYSYVLVVPAGSAIDSIGALVARAKSPQGVKFGYGGVGIWVGLASGLAVVACLMIRRWIRRDRLGLVPTG